MEKTNPLAEVRALFLERYKLIDPVIDSDGVRAIDAAIKAGKTADIAALRTALAQYNLYPQFSVRINALLDSVEVPASEEASPPSEAPLPEAEKSISRMNKAELAAAALKHNIDPTDATVAELREALHEDE